MSLQVWLPLNGNINNQGLSNITFSAISTNTSSNANGKIGSCYVNNSFASGGLISSNTISLGTKQSMFCWVKFTSLYNSASLGGGLVSQHRYQSNRGMGLTIKYVSSTTGYLSVNTGNGSSRTYNTYCATTLMTAGTWYHVGYTYDGANIRLYVNGVLEATHAYANMSVPADYLMLFCWSLSGTSGNGVCGDYKLNGYLNDVRIYDHCLSPKEVKEISKGMVLHYRLAGVGAHNMVNSLTAGVRTTIVDNYSIDANFGAELDTYCYINCSAMTLGTQYTLSFDVSGMPNGSAWAWRLWNRADYEFTVTKDGRYSYTFTPTASKLPSGYSLTRFLFDDGGRSNPSGTVRFSNFKLEEGSVATPWCPNPSDTLYTQLGFNDNIEYDCSGLRNNGTKVGAITWSGDTPRYSGSYNFPNNTSYIKLTTLNTAGFANSYSISWWGNLSNYIAKMMWGFGDGNRLNFYDGLYNNTADGVSNPFYSSGTIIINRPSINVWHHFVLVGDGSTSKLYMDGSLYGTAKTYKAITGSQIYINGWDAAANYKMIGNLSDFRIYATALSADDIKELYKTSAIATNNGSLMAYELIEE